MTRVLAPRLPLAGLAGCLAHAGLTWEQAAHRLFLSPATLRSYTSRGAPISVITALTLLLDLPQHSSRSLFVRPPEGLRVRALREPHRTHSHQPALRGAAEQHTSHGEDAVWSPRETNVTTVPAPRRDWHQLALSLEER